jgi:hypothetical protein
MTQIIKKQSFFTANHRFVKDLRVKIPRENFYDTNHKKTKFFYGKSQICQRFARKNSKGEFL